MKGYVMAKPPITPRPHTHGYQPKPVGDGYQPKPSGEALPNKVQGGYSPTGQGPTPKPPSGGSGGSKK